MKLNRNYSKVSKTWVPPRATIHWLTKLYEDGSMLMACDTTRTMGPDNEATLHTKDVSCAGCLHVIFLLRKDN